MLFTENSPQKYGSNTTVVYITVYIGHTIEFTTKPNCLPRKFPIESRL